MKGLALRGCEAGPTPAQGVLLLSKSPHHSALLKLFRLSKEGDYERIHSSVCKALESELNRLKKAENLGNNKELLFSFYESNLARGISTPRILRLLTALRKTAEQLQKDFRETTKQDYEKFLIWMQRSDYAEGTIWTYKKILKVFHKWLQLLKEQNRLLKEIKDLLETKKFCNQRKKSKL